MNEKRGSTPIVLSLIGVLLVAAIAVSFAIWSIRFLDKKSWMSYSQDRWLVKALPYFYLRIPFSSDEDDIRRTIKLAHFIALSNINDKSLDVALLDIDDAQRLIGVFLKKNVHNLDVVDISELTLERLILLNRMNAILLKGNKRTPTDIESVRGAANNLLPTIADIETKRALQKELHLYDFSWQDANMKTSIRSTDTHDQIDAYHYGLARCVVRDEIGAQLIETALHRISKRQLIDITLRNIDHPLIASAGMFEGSSCAVAVDSIQKKIRE